MKSILNELDDIKVRKHVVTSYEYECANEQQEDEIFDAVREIITDGLDSFSKITYDILPSDHKVKVEVSQHKL